MVALKRGETKIRERRKREGETKIRERRKRDGENERERGDERLKKRIQKKKKGRYFGNKIKYFCLDQWYSTILNI